MNIWSISSQPDKDTKLKPAIGPRDQVKTVIQARQDVPAAARAALCAGVDGLPDTVSAVRVDATETVTDQGKRIGHYTIAPLY